MIIAIPVDEKSLEASAGDSFARSNYFLIYNLEDGSHSFEENIAKDSVGGAGLKAAQLLIDKDADGVITRRCGKKAGDVLDLGKVKIYKAADKSLQENIELVKEEKLGLIDEADYASGGGK